MMHMGGPEMVVPSDLASHLKTAVEDERIASWFPLWHACLLYVYERDLPSCGCRREDLLSGRSAAGVRIGGNGSGTRSESRALPVSGGQSGATRSRWVWRGRELPRTTFMSLSLSLDSSRGITGPPADARRCPCCPRQEPHHCRSLVELCRRRGSPLGYP